MFNSEVLLLNSMGLLSLFRKWNVTIMTQFKKLSVPIFIKTFGGTALSIIFIWWTIVSFIKGPSINAVGNYSGFLTPLSPMSTVF